MCHNFCTIFPVCYIQWYFHLLPCQDVHSKLSSGSQLTLKLVPPFSIYTVPVEKGKIGFISSTESAPVEQRWGGELGHWSHDGKWSDLTCPFSENTNLLVARGKRGLAFEQIARPSVCARVDKTYIYWWRGGHKSFIERVHQSIIDTLTNFQLGGFGGPVILPRFSPQGWTERSQAAAQRADSKRRHGFRMDRGEGVEREGEMVRKCVLSGVRISAVLVIPVPRVRINSKKEWKKGAVHIGGCRGHPFKEN